MNPFLFIYLLITLGVTVTVMFVVHKTATERTERLIGRPLTTTEHVISIVGGFFIVYAMMLAWPVLFPYKLLSKR